MPRESQLPIPTIGQSISAKSIGQSVSVASVVLRTRNIVNDENSHDESVGFLILVTAIEFFGPGGDFLLESVVI